jgi:hypothetical protein
MLDQARRAPRPAAIVAGAGLLLSLVALLETRPGLGSDTPSVRLTFTVPEVLILVSAAVVALAGLVVLLAARRRRTRGDETPEPARQPVPWWGRMLAEIGPVLSLLVVAAVLWLDGGRAAGALLALGRALFSPPDGLPPGAAEGPVVSLPWLGWAIGLLEVAVALMILALALVLLFAERIAAWWLARTKADEAVEFSEAVDEGLDDLADEPDARRGILACYRRFEQAAARARVRRAPWQTAEEFMRDVQSRLPLPGLAVERLTWLFEVARFSHHPVRSVERDLARTCLADIRAALERRDDPDARA